MGDRNDARGSHLSAPYNDPQLPKPRASSAVPVWGDPRLVGFTIPWQRSPGEDSHTIVLKASCDIPPAGPAQLRDEPRPPSGDVGFDDAPNTSALYPSDFAIDKRQAEVVLRGHAYPAKSSDRTAHVRFAFGSRRGPHFDRNIAVIGKRVWNDGHPSEPAALKPVPLVYERAFGGPSFEANPVGLGAGTAALPQLEHPRHLIKGRSDRPTPVAFCGTSAQWPARRALFGTLDDQWVDTRFPYFPADFDWSYFQTAPPEQRLESIAADAPYTLAGMRPDHAVIQGQLPGVVARCFIQRMHADGFRFEELKVTLDTAAFDSDALTLDLVWRGCMEAQDDEASDVVDVFMLLDGPGDETSLEQAHAQYAAQKALDEVGDDEADGLADAANDAAPEDAAAQRAQEEQQRRDQAGVAATAAVATAGAAVAAGALAPPAMLQAPERLGGGVEPSEAEAAASATREAMQARLDSDESLDGLSMPGEALSGLDFSGKSLRGAVLDGADLSGCRFVGADLSEAQLSGANLRGADFTDATLLEADLSGADLTIATLDGSVLTLADLSDACGEDASLRGTKGERTTFGGGKWTRACFDEAQLPAADFIDATLVEATFRKTVLSDVRLYDVQAARACFDEADLTGARADGAKLAGASFENVSADGSVWDGADLSACNFRNSSLQRVGLVKARAEACIFIAADLREGRLARAALSGARFIGANLMQASFERADLTNANLTGANLYQAETLHAKLDGVVLERAFVAGSKLEAR